MRRLMPEAVIRLFLLAAVSLLPACAGVEPRVPAVLDLTALQLPGGRLTAEAAVEQAPTPDLLALTDEMRDFVDRYVMTARSSRQRLNMLHSSLRSNALLGIDYDPEADGTAAQAFAQEKANCLTYAHLFISMARYAGLDARYHSLSMRPEWTRYGSRVALRQHVNVMVLLRRGEHYMVDIDPVRRDAVADRRLLADEDAFALFHNNIAMAKLRNEQVEEAYIHAIKAATLSPATDFLWVNLGTVYSRAGQAAAAEKSYLTAIEINPESSSAMNNLMVLKERLGRVEEAAFWEEQVEDHRERNPYYYAYLAEQAVQAGDLQAAVAHYRSAIKRKNSEAEFYFRLGSLYFAMEKPRQGRQFLLMAIDRAQLAGEKEQYEATLKRFRARTVAQLN